MARFIIMKSTRALPRWVANENNAYGNPATCERAGVTPGLVYATFEEAEADAQKLNSLPGVGFVVVRLAD